MPIFTVETTYALPIFRHASYRAGRIEEACRHALQDDDWSKAKHDYDNSGAVYVSGIWRGRDAAYRGRRVIAVPAEFDDALRHGADQHQQLLAMLKKYTRADDAEAQAAIAAATRRPTASPPR